MIEERTQTVGKIATDLQQQDTHAIEVREQGQEMTSSYLDELLKVLAEGKQKQQGDFFIVVLTKREKLLVNVIRNYFFYRHTCPTPDYDQAVYHYVKNDDELALLWVLPNRDYAMEIKDNALTLDREYKEILGYVLDFADGTLYKKACLLNKEDEKVGTVVLTELKA